ncbi:hypothetical protein [Bacteroides difficilis]|uniref:GLUG domain-containing protein n=1 Tax=Bacteroides difficilis TaxID=2763021 RepID=A0ABR7C976_9BACE|nr:hypothetical protein [Bacteroides difficilis]MBC5604337.1 hypothetical protein [Bacteroides difficilis]
MKNNILLYLLGLILLVGCNKDEENKYISFALDTEHNSVEGSFVQGAELLSNCQASISYVNAVGGTATFSSEEVNGIRIEKTSLALDDKAGTVKLRIMGVPVELGIMYLPVSVEYMGYQYETTVSVVIFEDTDPSGSIEFKMEATPITNMKSTVEIPFTVLPTMAAVTASELQGLNVKITQDLNTGQGVVTLIPNAELLSGTVEITASFGARTPVVKEISVNAFSEGAGTVESPYQISDADGLNKLRFALDKAFILTDDIEVESNWAPVGTLETPFVGVLNGDGHQITYHINAPINDSQAFFGAIGTGAEVKNLNFSGEVTGRNIVAGVAASSVVALENCNADNVLVKGENNLAVLIASGEEKDSRILTIGKDFPTLINITLGEMSASELLDVLPLDISINVVTNTTNADISYSFSDGKITADITNGGFENGDITIELKLAETGSGSNVISLPKIITIASKKMNEGGDGSESSPYIVADGEQLAAMMTNAPSSYIVLQNDIQLAGEWAMIGEFAGDLDGKGYTVTGLKINAKDANSGFVKTNKGTIHDLKFVDVDVAATKSFGTIAGINQGTVRDIEVSGKIVSTNTGDLLGGIVGDNLAQGVIENCYVNLDMTATCGMVGGIAGRNKGTGSEAIVRNCTSEGTLTVTGSKTRIAGIVGRGEGPDLIKGCLSSMTITATTSGANGVGGIFGANNNNDMKIEECMFTGTVRSGNDVGGIAGVGVNVLNCLVENASVSNTVSGSNGNAAGICGTNKKYATNCIVRNTDISGIVGTSKAVTGINGNYQNNGTTKGCVVESTTIKGAKVQRISAINPATVSSNPGAPLADNWTYNVTLLDGNNEDISSSAIDDAAGLDGGTVSQAQMTQSWYQSLGFDMNVWEWKDGKLTLKNVGYKRK